MAIDLSNPLLNGPRRVDARPVPRLDLAGPARDEAAPEVPTVAPLSEDEISGARTLHGGWTRATLAGWGVAWPPPKGWKERLLLGLAQKPATPRASVAGAQLSFDPPGERTRVPNPHEPDFDSTRHGLLAPPRVTYRKCAE